MKKSKWKGFKNKLSFDLIRSIFSIYIGFAIFVTLIQVFFEIINVENQIKSDLKGVYQSKAKFLKEKIYYIDDKSIKSILNEIIEVPVIKGIELYDIYRNKTFKKGIQTKQSDDPNNSYLDRQIIHQFKIYDEKTNNLLGKGKVLSSKREVFERLKVSLILILINAFIKTFFIWFVMVKVFIRFLEVPLSKFGQKINNLNHDNLKEINIKMKKGNELDFLVKNFNKLIEKINSTKDKTRIYREMLESRAEKNIILIQEKEKKLEYILKNVKKGFVTIGEDYLIESDYSPYSLQLLKTSKDEILKENAFDLIFNEKTNLFSQKEEIKKNIALIFNSEFNNKLDLLLEKLPQKMHKIGTDNNGTYYFSWNILSEENKKVNKLLLEFGHLS